MKVTINRHPGFLTRWFWIVSNEFVDDGREARGYCLGYTLTYRGAVKAAEAAKKDLDFS